MIQNELENTEDETDTRGLYTEPCTKCKRWWDRERDDVMIILCKDFVKDDND